MDQGITIEFKNAVDLAELIKKYGHNFDEYETLQIGHDGKPISIDESFDISMNVLISGMEQYRKL